METEESYAIIVGSYFTAETDALEQHADRMPKVSDTHEYMDQGRIWKLILRLEK